MLFLNIPKNWVTCTRSKNTVVTEDKKFVTQLTIIHSHNIDNLVSRLIAANLYQCAQYYYVSHHGLLSHDRSAWTNGIPCGIREKA